MSSTRVVNIGKYVAGRSTMLKQLPWGNSQYYRVRAGYLQHWAMQIKV